MKRVAKAILSPIGAWLLAIAIHVGTVGAQQPTSTPRIPISKESPPKAILRVDTLWQYRTDTLQVPSKPDTVVVTRTVSRMDTVYVHDRCMRLAMTKCTAVIGGAVIGLGAWAVCSFTDLCDSGENVRQTVDQSSIYSNTRNSIPRRKGFHLTLLTLPLRS